ncbi:MAG: ATP-binding protein [Pseudomonadota bacterium]
MFHRPFSIRRYLLATLLLVATLSMAITGWFGYRAALEEVEELFDAQLAQSARVLIATLTTQPLLLQAEGDTVVFPAWQPDTGSGDETMATGVDDDQATPWGHRYETRLVFQLWEGHDRLLMRSANAPLQPLADFAAGYSKRDLAGEAFHVFALSHDGLWLLVAQDDYMRDELASEIALATFVPHLVGIPLMALLIGLLIGRGLAPLERLRRALAGRDAHNLEPVGVSDVGVELQPMVEELNELLSRLQASFERERRFTADASHELRTPLAALRVQAENALAATDDEARRHALAALLRGVDRAARLVSQLLTLARLEPDMETAAFRPQRLDALIREELAELAPLAMRRRQEFEFTDEMPGAVVAGDAALLGILIRNLADNALRYSPEGSLVRVLVRDAGQGQVEMQVLDEGPGVPPGSEERVFERFFRVDSGRGDGAGLGLAIVRRIAERHGGSVTVLPRRDGAPGGFRVLLPLQR